MVKLTGGRQVADRLRALTSPQAVESIGAALFTAGQLIENEAGHSITTGSVGGKHHVASRPGEAPNEDTGVLARNIETVHVEPLKVLVESKAPYAAALEYGTSKMAERPYMRPAVEATRGEVVATVKQAVDAIVAGKRVD